jgi:protein-S-isoprenylcysteine O-methyltransferase Ste14
MMAAALAMWALAAWSPHFRLPLPLAWLLPALIAAAAVGVVTAGVLAIRHWGTTIDPTRPASASHLVTGGVYRITRNPMYLGFSGLLLAWGLHLQAWWCLALPPIFMVYIAAFQILPEERALKTKFGAEFDAYAAQVRRWL